MWTATVDFMKAFDSISHNSIWEALKSCNIDHDYINLPEEDIRRPKRHLYRQTKRATFSTSRKGTKQDDPLSSSLFNTVLQYSLKDEIQTMAKEKNEWVYT